MSRLADFLMEQRWAMHPPVLRSLTQVVQRHLDGVRLTQAEVDEIVAASPARQRERPHELQVRDGVATIPLHGVISRRSSMLDGISQPRGTSVDAVRAQLREALSSREVRGILLDVDSPGGTVTGVPELADEIRAARGTKPIWAHVDGLMASAALWLGAQADRVLATRASEIGSIGVYQVLDDMHRWYEAKGIDTHVVATGPNKGAGVPGSKLTTEQLATFQHGVDEYFGLFREAVQAGRGLDDAGFAAVSDGRTWIAGSAQELGLVDGVATREQVEAELRASLPARRAGSNTKKAAAVAAQDFPPRAPDESRASTNERTNEMAEHETIEALEQAYPELCAQLREEGRSGAAEAERTRCAQILELSTPSQAALVAEHVRAGSDIATAARALVLDPRRDAHLRRAELEAAAPPAIDGSAPEAVDDEPETLSEDAQIEREAARIWAEDPDAERVYQSPQALQHYLRAKRRGLTCS